MPTGDSASSCSAAVIRCCVIASKNDIYNREALPHNLQRYVPNWRDS